MTAYAHEPLPRRLCNLDRLVAAMTLYGIEAVVRVRADGAYGAFGP